MLLSILTKIRGKFNIYQLVVFIMFSITCLFVLLVTGANNLLAVSSRVVKSCAEVPDETLPCVEIPRCEVGFGTVVVDLLSTG